MEFLAPPWLLPLIIAPGLWLAWRLYGGRSGAVRARFARPAARVALALLTVAVWILLAVAVVGPRFAPRAPVWHPPLVVLALDDSRSHAITGARAAALPSLETARAHYESRGFEVVVVRFAETVSAADGASDVSGARDDTADGLTSLEALRRHVAGRDGGASLPNLRAVILWTDGRFHDDEDTLTSVAWPAPVFPVRVPADWYEAQGERAVLDLTETDGPRLELAWRALGDEVGGVRVALRRGDTALWDASFARSPGMPAGALEASRAVLPASLRSRLRADGLTLLVRPDGDAATVARQVAANDTAPLDVRRDEGPRHLLVRPLTTLDERGLADALAASGEVAVVSSEALSPRRGDVIWINAASTQRAASVRAVAARTGVPVVVYHLSFLDSKTSAARAVEGGSRDANNPSRLAWKREGDAFMPSGALALGDIAGEFALTTPARFASDDFGRSDTLAWAEVRGARLPLFWRESLPSGTSGAAMGYGILLPPLWAAGFRSGEDASVSATSAAAWVRGLGAWAASRGHARVEMPADIWAGRSLAVTAHLPDTAAAVFVHAYGTRAFGPPASGLLTRRADSIVLPAGRHDVAVHSGGDTTGALVWSGVASVRSVRDGEAARLGTDEEALASLAARTTGDVIRLAHADSTEAAWPELPRGHMRAVPSAPRVLMSPLVASILIGVGLVVAWGLRRRLRLD